MKTHPVGSEGSSKPSSRQTCWLRASSWICHVEGPCIVCCFGLKAVTDGELLKKPTTVYITDESYEKPLRKPCARVHEHGATTAGQNTKPAGQYTASSARAVVRGHWAMRKRRQTILDALAVEHQLLPAEGGGDGVPRGPSEDLTTVKIDDRPRQSPFQAMCRRPQPALRRVHQNMGHPSDEDLARHLCLAGAAPKAVKACQQLRCQTCRSTTAGSRRPAKVVKPPGFNEEVAVDTMHLYTVAHPVPGRKGEGYARGFLRAWMAWAGHR